MSGTDNTNESSAAGDIMSSNQGKKGKKLLSLIEEGLLLTTINYSLLKIKLQYLHVFSA